MDKNKFNKERVLSEKYFRSLNVRKGTIDIDARTVEVAWASEEPYERWFGMEILGMDKSEIDLSFVKGGRAPLLADHNTSDVVGVIEKAWVDPDRKGRALVRFGKSDRASEIFDDVVDGIRGNVSVGYEISDMKLEETKGDLDTYRVTRWKPYEFSMVSLPADATVGVGRSKEIKKEIKMSEKKPVEIDTVKIAADVRKDELHRIKELTALGAMHKCQDEATKAVEDGKSVDQFRGELLEIVAKRKTEEVKTKEIGLSEKEIESYSFMRLIKAMSTGDWREAGFEQECHRAFEKENHRSAKGCFIPPDVLMKGMKRDLVANIGSAGGYLVQDETGSFIDMLRNSAAVMSMGATVLSGLQGDLELPKQTGGATAYWVGEGDDLTESQQTLGQVRLTPKSVGAFTDISRRMMIQSSVSVENFVRQDFARVMALAIDSAAINGAGSPSVPQGILNTTGIGSVTLNAASTPNWGDIVDLETAVAVDNALAGSLGYLATSTIAGNMKQTSKDSGSGLFLLDKGQTNGYNLTVSNNVPAKYMLFGNWADVIIGFWSGLDVTVDTSTLSKSGGTRVVVFQDCDVALRHAESMAKGYKA